MTKKFLSKSVKLHFWQHTISESVGDDKNLDLMD